MSNYTKIFIHYRLQGETARVLLRNSAALAIPVDLKLTRTDDNYVSVVVDNSLATLTNRERLAYKSFTVDWGKVKHLLRGLTLAKAGGKKRKEPWCTSACLGRKFWGYQIYLNRVVESLTGESLTLEDQRLLDHFFKKGKNHRDQEVEPLLHFFLWKKRQRALFIHVDDKVLQLMEESQLCSWLGFKAAPAELRPDEPHYGVKHPSVEDILLAATPMVSSDMVLGEEDFTGLGCMFSSVSPYEKCDHAGCHEQTSKVSLLRERIISLQSFTPSFAPDGTPAARYARYSAEDWTTPSKAMIAFNEKDDKGIVVAHFGVHIEMQLEDIGSSDIEALGIPPPEEDDGLFVWEGIYVPAKNQAYNDDPGSMVGTYRRPTVEEVLAVAKGEDPFMPF